MHRVDTPPQVLPADVDVTEVETIQVPDGKSLQQPAPSVEAFSPVLPTPPPVSAEISERSSFKRRNSVSLKTAGYAVTASRTLRRQATRLSLSPTSTKALRKARFAERHGAEAQVYIDQTAAIARRIKEAARQKRFVLTPGKNKFLSLWDLVSTCALLYTATLTPFEAAFISPTLGPAAWGDEWFIINRCLDLVFFFDMCLQFFGAIPPATSPPTVSRPYSRFATCLLWPSCGLVLRCSSLILRAFVCNLCARIGLQSPFR